MEWQLKDARNQFSKLVQQALDEGPQIVTLRGKRAAIVLSAAAYDALNTKKATLVADLLCGPVWDDELADSVSARSKTPSRNDAVHAVVNPWDQPTH